MANVFDVNGNGLLLNEIVMNDKNYKFEHVSSSLYVLVEQTSLSQDISGLKATSVHQGSKTNSPQLKWCFQNYTMGVVFWKTAEILLKKKLSSTSKRVVFIKPDSNLFYGRAKLHCLDICGRLYFPSSFSEMNEIKKYASHNQWSSWRIWLRISYDKQHWYWKDPDEIQNLELLNWGDGDRNLKPQNNALLASDGKWYASNGNYQNATHLICELS